MKKIFFLPVVLVTVLLISLQTEAQFSNGGGTPGGGGSGGGIPPTGGGPVVPFDGGMSLMLLASGIGYGFDKLKKR